MSSTKETKKGNEISEEQYNKLLLRIYTLMGQCTNLENRLADLELTFAKHTHTYSIMTWGNKQTYLQTKRPSGVSQNDILKLLQRQPTVDPYKQQ